MSIQRCEYEITEIRGERGLVCTLTGRACYITDLLGVDKCYRRGWANQYQAKHPTLKQESCGIAMARAPEAIRANRAKNRRRKLAENRQHLNN